MPNRALIWKKLLLSALSLVATVAGLELGAQAWDYLAYGTRRVDGRPQGLYLSDGSPFPQLKPGAELSGLRHSVRVNALGLRGPELPRQKPPNGVRIWCVGGSTTFDIFASDNDHTWPAVAQQKLEAALPGRTVEVINGGIPGDILEGSARLLNRVGRNLGIDYVVVYHGPNDMRAVSGGHLVIAESAFIPLRSLELLRTAALDRGIGTGTFPSRAPTPQARQDLSNRLRNLERQIYAIGARPIYASHALRIAPDADGAALRRQAGELPAQLQMSPASTRDWYDLWNEMMLARAQESRAPFIDVRAAVGPDAHLWGDATHFSDSGAALAGDAVATGVLEHLGR